MQQSKDKYKSKIEQLLEEESNAYKNLADLDAKKAKFGFGGLFGSLSLLASVTATIISAILFPGHIESLILFGICSLVSGIATLNTLPQYFKYRKATKMAKKNDC